jgi:hypothetical protein
LIDQICTLLVPSRSESELYTYGLVGCAVMLWEPRGISAKPIGLGFLGLRMSIVMKPSFPTARHESGPPVESAAVMTVFRSCESCTSPWLTAHGR